MRVTILTLLLLATLLSFQNSSARGNASPDPEPDSGAVVCPPGIYPAPPDECLPLGPSETLTRAAEAGVPYPILPLPAYKPGAALNDIPYLYFKVTEGGAPLYLSLDDALGGRPSARIAPGHLYVSYVERAETAKGIYYRLRSGAWIKGDGARAAVPNFQGLLFSSQPENAFGWVLGETKSRTTPGYNTPETGRTYYRYNIVQVFGVQQADNNTWVMIGPDEWLDYHHVARVEPRTSPPEGVTTGRWIEINLDEQTVAVYQGNRLVFATLIASGIDPYWTRPGLFQIYKKKAVETMSGSSEADRSDYYYLEDVPWTMYFDEARALHGAYWHNGFGYARSHGCVNLSIGDSRWLFDWANEGDTVYVFDPSGRTPTDPSLYGAGAP